MNSNSPSENYFQEKPETASKLSQSQQRIIDRVLTIIESKEDLNKALSEAFKEKTKDVLSHPGKFTALTDLIDTKMQKALSEIENQFNIHQDSNKALNDSKIIIQNATREKV
jgi:hypothetical protein